VSEATLVPNSRSHFSPRVHWTLVEEAHLVTRFRIRVQVWSLRGYVNSTLGLPMPPEMLAGRLQLETVLEVTVKKIELSLPQLLFVAATRGALGMGIGLLVADHFRRAKRRRIGATLLTLGALTTIPAAYLVFGRGSAKSERVIAAA
jgi:hypothetical protein